MQPQFESKLQRHPNFGKRIPRLQQHYTIAPLTFLHCFVDIFVNLSCVKPHKKNKILASFFFFRATTSGESFPLYRNLNTNNVACFFHDEALAQL